MAKLIRTGTPINITKSGAANTLTITAATLRDPNTDTVGTGVMYINDISIEFDVPFVEPLAISDLIEDTTNNLVRFNYNALSGTNYSIDRITTMLPSGEPDGWLDIEESITADEVIETFTDNGASDGNSAYFCRVRIATK